MNNSKSEVNRKGRCPNTSCGESERGSESPKRRKELLEFDLIKV